MGELKARLYRRAGGKKIVVAEGVLQEEEPPQFLASDGKLYRWDQDYEEGGVAVYFWYRDLPAFEVTSPPSEIDAFVEGDKVRVKSGLFEARVGKVVGRGVSPEFRIVRFPDYPSDVELSVLILEMVSRG